LYEQSVTILPANGDYATPNGSRFVESLLFNLTRFRMKRAVFRRTSRAAAPRSSRSISNRRLSPVSLPAPKLPRRYARA
jgi:hypothetical protein